MELDELQPIKPYLDKLRTIKTDYKYIHFRRQQSVYVCYECKTNKDNNVLGFVKFYSAWRQYCFFPTSQAVYSSGCLKDIGSFLEDLNKDGYSKRKIV